MKFERVVEEYNSLMFWLGTEFSTIGTTFSESTDGWNIRDMVSEVAYNLQLYLDPNCTPYIDAHNGDDDDLAQWNTDVRKMRNFIRKHKEEAMQTKCTTRHCSSFD